jgi:hypothetical protein
VEQLRVEKVLGGKLLRELVVVEGVGGRWRRDGRGVVLGYNVLTSCGLR